MTDRDRPEAAATETDDTAANDESSRRDAADDPVRGSVGILGGAGLLALLLAVASALIWGELPTSGLVMLVVGFGLIALFLLYNADRLVKVLARKRALVGANVVLMIILATVLLVLISTFNGCAEGLAEDSTLGRLGMGTLSSIAGSPNSKKVLLISSK